MGELEDCKSNFKNKYISSFSLLMCNLCIVRCTVNLNVANFLQTNNFDLYCFEYEL